MTDINRIVWMVIFLLGILGFTWMEWHGSNSSQVIWFFLTSMWSAVCAIGYTILHWILVHNKKSDMDSNN